MFESTRRACDREVKTNVGRGEQSDMNMKG